DRERAEQARLFYVAGTRAEDVLVLLESKGDARYLHEEKGERHVWCHQVWEVLGRARLAAVVARGAPEETPAPAAGGAVRVARAGPRDGGGRRPGGGRLRGGSRRRDRPSRRRPPRGAGAPAVRAGRARDRSAGRDGGAARGDRRRARDRRPRGALRARAPGGH